MRRQRQALLCGALALCAGLAVHPGMAQQSPAADGAATAAPAAKTWVAADRNSEAALHFTRRDIAQIQAQLTALGLDPKGIDGKMGPGTRKALAEWQKSQSIPATGYLTHRQRSQLRLTSLVDYSIWLNDANNKARLERAARPPVRTAPKGWYRNSRGQYCRSLLLGAWCQKKRPHGLW